MRQGSCVRYRRGIRWLLTALLTAACGQPTAATIENIDDGPGLAGELEAYIATYEDGSTAVFYGLRRPSDEKIDLVFDAPPDIDPGSYVVVQGSRDPENKVHVTSIRRRPVPFELERRNRGELAVPLDPGMPISLSVAVLILDSAYTVPQANKRLLDDFDGPRNFYRENTYGNWILEGEAFGPYTVDVSS